MKHLPANETIIQLSLGDMQQAVEFWLNQQLLKEHCTVTAVKEMSIQSGCTFEIEFGRELPANPVEAE